jgi:hypothetical protein
MRMANQTIPFKVMIYGKDYGVLLFPQVGLIVIGEMKSPRPIFNLGILLSMPILNLFKLILVMEMAVSMHEKKG